MFWSETLTCISYDVVDICIRKEKKKKSLSIRNKTGNEVAEKTKRMEKKQKNDYLNEYFPALTFLLKDKTVTTATLYYFPSELL